MPSGDGLWEKLSEKLDAVVSVSLQETNQKITRRFQVVDAACEKLQDLLHQTVDMLGSVMKAVDTHATQSSMEIVAQAIEKITTHVEKLGPQLDQCLQNIAAASQAEKGRFTMLDGAIKSKIDQVHGEVVAKLGSVETTHSKLQSFLPQLQSAIGKLDNLPDKLDRTESLFRERVQNLQEDMGKLQGAQSAAAREEAGLLRQHTKAVEGMQQSIATVQSALGQPPVDSQGMVAVRELVTNTDNTVQEMTTMLQELTAAITELKDKIPERPPYRQPPAQASTTSQDAMPMQAQQGQMGGSMGGAMPPVIDLSSRIPIPPQMGGRFHGPAPGGVAVTFPSGVRCMPLKMRSWATRCRVARRSRTCSSTAGARYFWYSWG